ncbi:hypothetical protein KFE25_003768 [Diacronema lutheri]|uniref:Uncharacterized protein n=1 Tax=Diacronema lutheri TaxID=2081491 RepID=A0A8J6C1D3_DIALT|nr:hypothetical protein KFE25_003768 [Diacronema lutheri]
MGGAGGFVACASLVLLLVGGAAVASLLLGLLHDEPMLRGRASTALSESSPSRPTRAASPAPEPEQAFAVGRRNGHLPIAAPTFAKNCDDWPSTDTVAAFESLGIDITGMGWRCLDASRVERLERDRGEVRAGVELSPAQCKAWCLKQHPRELFLEDGAAGWCCEWRPDNAGECAWSDGVARFTPIEGMCEPGRGGAHEPCARSLAYNLCELAEGFRLFDRGRCLFHRDVVLAQLEANSRNECSVLCDQYADNVVSGEQTCTGFAYLKSTKEAGRGRHRRQQAPCILLSKCKRRPRASDDYDFFLRPEAIPPLPALT